ncbi:MAG: AarF/ABC1/UbiB kinase family protein [Leptolyngbya sp. SIO4C1]|nr:AarF/ABC1/UbiB kinase family protein [Leptolyngbya sp. SIO4C1]
MKSAVSSQLDRPDQPILSSGSQADLPAASPQPKSAPASLADILVYDPAAIASYYGRRPLQIIGRLLEILWLFVGYGLKLLWDWQTNQQQQNELKRAVQLRQLLTRLGPAYIKIGQALSTRPDLVSPIYMSELVKLQDQLPPFPNEIAFRFIEEELGQPPEAIYDDLSPTPVAAASLGQVYKGKLKTGEPVAVKVQRPGLAQKITRDLYILRGLSQWVTNHVQQVRSDLVSIMDEFGARIFEEMDYNHEAQNAERFAELYGYLPNIIVPSVYRQYTARRVMTMEWINGMKLTQPEKLQAQGLNPTSVIETGVQCSLRQLLEHGFFHADPHPGNLLVTPDGKLAYLDFGMMCQVEPYQRYGLIEAIVHMVNRDFEGLAQDYVKLEFLDPDTDLTPIIPALAEVFNNALGATVAELNLKSITDEFSALMYEYPFRVPAYYALIIRSLVTLDGIAISVDPNFKVLSKAYPYVSKRLLTDPAPELRQSLQELLFKEGSFRWNRLENLLRNARNSDDYDLNRALNQALDFLFSERGTYIRDRIADELAKGLDQFGYRLLSRLQYNLKSQFGSDAEPSTVPAQAAQSNHSWDHLVRILTILRDTQGFDTRTLATVLPQVLTKPETRDMGRRVVNGVMQRALARIIREVLLSDRPLVPPADQPKVLVAASGSQ